MEEIRGNAALRGTVNTWQSFHANFSDIRSGHVHKVGLDQLSANQDRYNPQDAFGFDAGSELLRNSGHISGVASVEKEEEEDKLRLLRGKAQSNITSQFIGDMLNDTEQLLKSVDTYLEEMQLALEDIEQELADKEAELAEEKAKKEQEQQEIDAREKALDQNREDYVRTSLSIADKETELEQLNSSDSNPERKAQLEKEVQDLKAERERALASLRENDADKNTAQERLARRLVRIERIEDKIDELQAKGNLTREQIAKYENYEKFLEERKQYLLANKNADPKSPEFQKGLSDLNTKYGLTKDSIRAMNKELGVSYERTASAKSDVTNTFTSSDSQENPASKNVRSFNQSAQGPQPTEPTPVTEPVIQRPAVQPMAQM